MRAPQADGAAGAALSPRGRSAGGGSGAARRRPAPAADAPGDDELDELDELDGLDGAIDPSPFMDAVIKGASLSGQACKGGGAREMLLASHPPTLPLCNRYSRRDSA